MKRVEPPREFYTSLIRTLERSRVSNEDAVKVAAAVQALPTDAPLTLDVIDRLGLNAGLRANLIFAWLHHRYPDLIENEITAGDTLADILKRLTGGGELPEPLVEFHRSLAEGPELGVVPELTAIEMLLDEGKLKYVAEQNGKLLFVADREGKEFDFAIEKKTVTWEGGTVDLESIAPKYLKKLQQALARGAKNAALGRDGLKLQRDLDPIIENWEPPVHPVLARLETVLRLELGVLRVGESNLDTLNSVIEQVLQASANAMSIQGQEQKVEEVLADLVSRRPRMIAEEPPAENTPAPQPQPQPNKQPTQKIKPRSGQHMPRTIDESLGELVLRLEQLNDALSRIRR
jgi:hypothetical protein